MAVWFVFVNAPLRSCVHKTLYQGVCDHICLKRDLEFVSSETEKMLLSKVTLHGQSSWIPRAQW